jgi:hypothetical protein
VKGKSYFQPQIHYFVGGATKLYGAALYRMRRPHPGPDPLSSTAALVEFHFGLTWPIPTGQVNDHLVINALFT